MKSRKKKPLPTRAKRYQNKQAKSLDYGDLEARQLLAVASAASINFVGTTDLINLSNPVHVSDGVDVLRSQLELGQNESLKLEKASADRFGFEQFKYQQYYNNIPVEGSSYTLHVKDSQIVSLSGDRVGLVSPVDQIELTSEEALQLAMDYTGSDLYAWQDGFTSEILGLDGAPEGELVYISDPLTGVSIPAYKFDMFAIDLGTRDFVYVNANSGAIEAAESRIRNADVPGTGFSLYNGNVAITVDEFETDRFRLQQVTDGVQTFDAQTLWTPPAGATDIVSTIADFNLPEHSSGVSAHFAAEQTLKMYSDWFGRDSYDDFGADLISYVNVGENWVNATWNGSFMQYGEGNGTFGPLVSLDIGGHEIAHGLTEFSAGLLYRWEQGGLNESFSDIFGEVLEFFATGSDPDWVSGDDIIPGGIRSFIDPKSLSQPDTYLGEEWINTVGCSPNGFNDFCGVHTNSGVQNKWFFILSEGESGINDNGDVYDVAGIGIEKAAQIAYRNLNVYLGANSQYQDARDGAVQAAVDIYGENSPEHIATNAAWIAVGVYPGDIIIEEVDEIMPGSMIYTAEGSATLPAVGTRGVVVQLDAGQTLSGVVYGKAGVAPKFTVVDPNGLELAAASPVGFQASFDSVPVDIAGQYTINVSSDNGVLGDIDVRIVINASLESEIGQGIVNGDLANAQNLESSLLELPEISADHLAVYGEFDISEIPSFVSDTFETGVLDGNWTINSTEAAGRIAVDNLRPAAQGDYALFMDTTAKGVNNLNEAIWTVDLSTISSPFLNFFYASFNDESTVLPVSYNGSIAGDGVSISEDGSTWHTILTDTVTNPGEWNQFSINLEDVASQVGITLGENFQVKFQQYDDDIHGADGRGFDAISLTAATESEDWYSFDLEANEIATLAVGKTVVSGAVQLSLYDTAGNLILAGTPGDGVESRINQFVAPATGTYYARLVGSATPYGFLVTRGTEFDTGSSLATPINVNPTDSVFGFVNTAAQAVAEPDVAIDKTVLDNYFPGVTLSNNITGGSVYAVRTTFEAPTGGKVFAPTITGEAGWLAGVNELRADFDIMQQFVTLQFGAQETSQDVGTLRAFDIFNNQIDFNQTVQIDPGGVTDNFCVQPDRQIAYIIATGFKNDVTPIDKLSFEVEDLASDYYSYDVGANEVIEVNASFPGSGPNLFENGLIAGSNVRLRLDLIDPAGNVVATGTDSLNHYSEAGGTHIVRAYAESEKGTYQLSFNSEIQVDRVQIGSLGLGVAVSDDATGVGYMMYSSESVHTRFAANPVFSFSADHMVAVRYNGGWEYNNNNDWFSFTTTAGDRLVAVVDFDADTANSLEGMGGVVHGIPHGFFGTSDMNFLANSWDSSFNEGEFQVTGSYFYTGDEIVQVGAGNYGIVSDDAYAGEGYMMYTQESATTRFPSLPGVVSENIVTVRFQGGVWQVHDNNNWVDFTPVASDQLIAHIDYATNKVSLLNGKDGQVSGIDRGMVRGDINFTKDSWFGSYNEGEFEFTGTEFVANQTATDVGPTNLGILVEDSASGTGYIMHSVESLKTRFTGIATTASDHLIAVRFDTIAGSWQYNDDSGWVDFAPAEGDHLIANVDFSADTAALIEGYGGRVNGILQGFADSDLQVIANEFNGATNNGEFTVTGTYFSTMAKDVSIGSLGLGIAVDDDATGTGYLMYSEQLVHDRFAGNSPFVLTASNLIAVRNNGGVWEYNDNSTWHAFTAAEGDRLLATVDFDANTVTSLHGATGNIGGIARGFYGSDLTFVADSWAGNANDGEFEVMGSSFIS